MNEWWVCKNSLQKMNQSNDKTEETIVIITHGIIFSVLKSICPSCKEQASFVRMDGNKTFNRHEKCSGNYF